MRRSGIIAAAIAVLAGLALPVGAQQAALTAAQILDKVDAVINAPQDQSYTMQLILIDKDSSQKTRELVMIQKGRDRRLVRFLSPADQRGIAFLSLPGDLEYLYLPAFGKVRRIASSNLNTDFAGTDFTYDDLSAVRWSDGWSASILRQEQGATVLELTPKPGNTSEYPKVLLWVRQDNFYPVRMEQYDTSGSLVKVMVREGLQQIQGYWIATTTTMENVKKRHKTEMIVSNVKLDTGISDDTFTERYLTQ